MSLVPLAVAALAQGAVLIPVPPPPIVRTNSVPPPVIITPTAPPAPPMPVIRSDYIGGTYDRPTTTLTIRVTAGASVLLNERLRVGRTGATYNLTRSESADPVCSSVPYPVAERHSFSLSIRPEGPTKDHYRVNVNWSRPTSSCALQGNRGVSLDQAVAIKPGQAAAIDGDAGLRVEIRRP